LQTAQWLKHPLINIWFQAVAANPDAFLVNAYSYSQLMKLIPATASKSALSFCLHLEWTLLSQLIWDHTVNTCRDLTLLERYSHGLLVTNNDVTEVNPLSATWGFFSHPALDPFLVHLHPLTSKQFDTLGGRWSLICTASPPTSLTMSTMR
jgi:hypothetical protein